MQQMEREPLTLKSIDRALRPALNSFVKRVSYDSEVELWRVMQDYPQVIHVMNHGPMFGPWPAAAYLAKKAVDNGGGDRTPFAMFHRIFFKIPIVNRVIRKRLNSPRAFSFEEVLEHFRAGLYTDFMVLPEGDNCNYGNLEEIRPFRSHRYLELAVLLEAPILITIHRGTESWATQIALDNASMIFLKTFAPSVYYRVRETRIVNWQSLPWVIPVFQMKTKLYHPKLKKAALSQDPEERQQQIEAESLNVRKAMEAMLAELHQQQPDTVPADVHTQS